MNGVNLRVRRGSIHALIGPNRAGKTTCFNLLTHFHSPFGQVLKAIRENEARAVSLGYDTDRYKLLAYVLSATLSGVAGATNSPRSTAFTRRRPAKWC